MTQVLDKAVVDRVTGWVQSALDKRQPETYRVVISPEGIHEEDGHYTVVVVPDRVIPSLYDFYDVLAEAEEELQQERKLDVFLVPTLPPSEF